ncbi:MAG: acetyl-CoA carboxylase biotin carboxyl carrier protein [Candidatus Scalindua sp. AMX11]|nr:MAG: acetyl-CoA carboxylase biotin carboxyl carrier protein [Candidatus Scalindua sp.]NOG85980.1 acetyl-CoA carboxylase biotin carboxyl carrier protein [Planctomycetota bacterium]RZV91389.1 MAG: acetyl-CoA carboxylase biotin carboxyl carrier protein [Candidatus Scalindua sp. SCAELEC01]TDE65945.1 MAG: acetyl-CoA carboxylase biotin carboxyl carrier protein [Candidatus Scalindua sp. AMX11]
MDLIEKVDSLISLMNENNLAEIEIEEDGTKIRLKKSETNPASASVHMSTALQVPLQEGTTKYFPAKKSDSFSEIVAPMVGTYYSSAPGAEPYVGVGDVVDEETVVCILEAMKIMNEVKAEAKGKVVEILVENGGAVEYGQALFTIELEGDS